MPLLDALETGIVQLDSSNRVAGINAAAVQMLGLSGGPWPGRAADQIPWPADLRRWLIQVREQCKPLRVVEAVFADAPELGALDVRIHPHGAGVLLELSPVAERIRQREKLEQADHRQTLTRMLHTLAHELRNPLGGMRGAAQLIQQQTGDAGIARHADLIARQIDRITQLIAHFARDADDEPVAVNIHRLLDEAGELVLAETAHAVRVETDFDPSIPELTAQPHALGQLFLNLLRNAVQAQSVCLRLITRIEHASPLTERPGPALRVDVEDDGDGVPESLRGRLFLPMVSARPGGSGFGLAVAQEIARRHGGLVEYAPLDPGSRFTVRLPLEGHHGR